MPRCLMGLSGDLRTRVAGCSALFARGRLVAVVAEFAETMISLAAGSARHNFYPLLFSAAACSGVPAGWSTTRPHDCMSE